MQLRAPENTPYITVIWLASLCREKGASQTAIDLSSSLPMCHHKSCFLEMKERGSSRVGGGEEKGRAGGERGEGREDEGED